MAARLDIEFVRAHYQKNVNDDLIITATTDAYDLAAQ
jgi:hypothetical protein